MELGVYNPILDNKYDRYGKFPCLQQVAFNAMGPKGKDGLGVVALYPTQNIFKKAYGNYLGIGQLGTFMAHEMGLELKKVIIVFFSFLSKLYHSD